MADVTEVVDASEWAGLVKRSKSEKLHTKFSLACRSRGLPEFVTELRFANAERGWRRWYEKKTDQAPQWKFDFAWPQYMLAVELEGLVMRKLYDFDPVKRTYTPVWVCRGRHATPDGFKGDCEKYAAAAQLGWFVLRFEQDAIKSGNAIDSTIRVLHARGWRP